MKNRLMRFAEREELLDNAKQFYYMTGKGKEWEHLLPEARTEFISLAVQLRQAEALERIAIYTEAVGQKALKVFKD